MYAGYVKVSDITDQEWADICSNKLDGLRKELQLLENQYLIVTDDEDNLANVFIKQNNILHEVLYPVYETLNAGTIKPRNKEQYCAMDMMMDERSLVKLVSGTHGAGKDFIMMNAALSQIQEGKYDKLLYIRNNIDVANTTSLGALPGEKSDKMKPWLAALTDHVGGWEGLNMLITRGKIESEHLGYLRGRDIKNTIIYVTEAENLTKEHVQLLLGRVGEGSSLWMNGDYRQTDRAVFKQNSGMKYAVKALRGNPLFAYMNMPISERSAVAALADELDKVEL